MVRPDEPLFSELVVSSPRKRARPAGWMASAAFHVLLVAALVLVPIAWPEAPPYLPGDGIRVLIYDPPPPPPLPLPLGSGLVERSRSRVPAPAPTPEPARAPALVAPLTLPPAPLPSELGADELGGDPEGSLHGIPEGMPGGVEEGMVGGVPGGVPGGVIGGTGTGPVPVSDYDRPPRARYTTKPVYPAEAFVKKVEGTVLLEILIDDRGQVARIRVAESVPMLDQAAVDAVRRWVFEPAYRKGRPVPAVAWAPVSFRIY